MAALANNFDGGTDTVTISAANSGGASGNAFNTVGNTGGTHIYVPNGTEGLCSKMRNTTSSPQYLQWDSSYTPASATDYGRFYLWNDAATLLGTTYIMQVQNDAATLAWSMQMLGTRVLRVLDNPGAAQSDSTALAVGQWWRVEWEYLAQSSVTVRIYDNHSTTISQTVNRALAGSGPADIGIIKWGLLTGVADLPSTNTAEFFYWDHVMAGQAGWPGPAVVPAAVNPIRTVRSGLRW